MAYHKETTRIEPLTPEFAEKIAAMSSLPGERELKESHLRFLRNHLKQGSFVGPNWAIAVERATGKEFRINGHHSSTVLAALKRESFPQDLKVTVDTYVFDDIAEDTAGLFDLFDNPRSARSDTDFMGITRAKCPEFVESQIDNRFLVRVAAGIDINIKLRLEASDEGDPLQGDLTLYPHRQHGVYFATEKYRRFAVWLYQWRNTPHFSFIAKPGITSEILNDWTTNTEIAGEFWAFVFKENHPDPQDESRELVREIQAMNAKPKKPKAVDYQSASKKRWKKYLRFRESRAEVITDKAA